MILIPIHDPSVENQCFTVFLVIWNTHSRSGKHSIPHAFNTLPSNATLKQSQSIFSNKSFQGVTVFALSRTIDFSMLSKTNMPYL